MKFKIDIKKTVTYRYTVTVEAEHEYYVDYAIDCIDKNADCKEDIFRCMKDNNCKVIEFCEDGSPNIELECDDMCKISDYEEEEDK